MLWRRWGLFGMLNERQQHQAGAYSLQVSSDSRHAALMTPVCITIIVRLHRLYCILQCKEYASTKVTAQTMVHKLSFILNTFCFSNFFPNTCTCRDFLLPRMIGPQKKENGWFIISHDFDTGVICFPFETNNHH